MATDYGPEAGVYWAGPPRSYTTGRDTPVRLSVIHTTEGHANATSAEDGIAYDKTRSDGTSCHVFYDSDSSPQEVLRKNTAHSAFYHGNTLGIQHELCGTASWTPTQWQGGYQQSMLRRAARAVADDCRTYGLEPRRLSVAEVRKAYYGPSPYPKGICGHVDITNAFPEDNGSHYDPGSDFPWSQFIGYVKEYLGGSASGEGETMRFQFATNIGGDGRTIYVTDGLRYRILPQSYDIDGWMTSSAAGPVVLVSKLPGSPPWSLPFLINSLCGTPDPGENNSTGGGTSPITDEQMQQIIDGVVAGVTAALPDIPDDLMTQITQACKLAINGTTSTSTLTTT